MTRNRPVLLAIGILLAGGALCAGRDVADWDHVADLAPGTRVEVIHAALRRVQGSVVSVTPEAITVQAGATPEAISKNDVVRISILESSRKSRALIGMAVGASVGAVAFAVGAHTGDIDIRRDLMAGAGAVIGGGVGALIGAAAGGPKTIYRKP